MSVGIGAGLSINSCENCAAGKYESNEAGCIDASAGKYALEGTVALIDCIAGKYVALGSGVSAESCATCPAGTSITAGIGALDTDCILCAAGKYTDALLVLECTDCGDGTYTGADRAVCNNCPAGKYVTSGNGLSAASCIDCDPGQFSNAGAGQCNLCPAGSYSPVGAGDCILCPLGGYAGTAGTANACTLCDISSYSDQLGAAACTICPGGRITPALGATDLAQCVSPEFNFYTGFSLLAVLIPIILEYLIHGRYHRIAFLRQNRVTNRLTEEVHKISAQVQYYSQRAQAERIRDYTDRALKTWIFIVSSIFFALMLASLVFIGVLGSIFFKSMIIWRGFKLDLDFDFVEKMANSILKLAAFLKIPGFEYLFYPLEAMYKFFSQFKIDLSVINVTCKGGTCNLSRVTCELVCVSCAICAIFHLTFHRPSSLLPPLPPSTASAPMELLFNLMIMGICIIIIESNFQMFRAITFNALTDAFIGGISQPSYKEWAYRSRGSSALKSWGGTIKYFIIAVSVVFARAAGGFDFFLSFMQFLMSMTNITTFVEANFLHANSTECNNVAGFINFDQYIAFIASVEAWICFLPMVYEVSKILVPGLPKWADPIDDVDKKHDPKSSWMRMIKYGSYFAPDLWLSELASAWIRTVKAATPSTSTRNEILDEASYTGLNIEHKIKYLNFRVVFEEGVNVRASPSYDDALIIGSINVGGSIETCSDIQAVVVIAPNGVAITWIQLTSHYNGWVPTSTLDGQQVFELIPEAILPLAEPMLPDSVSTDNVDVGDLDAAENGTGPPASHSRASKRRSSAMRYDGVLQNMLRIQDDSEKCKPAFRVISTGSNGKADIKNGIYFSLPGYSVKIWAAYNDMHVDDDAYHLCLIDRASGKIESAFAYDITGTGKKTRGRRLRHLVYDLKEANASQIVVVFTTGNPGTMSRLSGGLPEAMFRCGASDAFVSSEFETNSAYVLIGIGGASKGKGFELNHGGNRDASIDTHFELTDSGFFMKHVEPASLRTNSCFCGRGSYLNAVFAKRTKEENKKWKEAQKNNMPSYFTLCRLEYQEFCEAFLSKCCHRLSPLSFLLTVTGCGHVLTKTGLKACYLVGWKIFNFFLLCIGLWTDDLVEMYKIHEHIRHMSIVWDKPFQRKSKAAYDRDKARAQEDALRIRKEKEASRGKTTPAKLFRDYLPTLPAWMTPAGGWLKDASSKEETADMAEAQQVDLKRMLRHNYSELLYAIVATRGVLLQAIPSLTILSIFASTMSRTPILVLSKRLAGNLPELLISKPFVEARVMEQELIDEQEWIRRSNLTEDQNCVQNPKTKMFKGVRVKVDPNLRKMIEEGNELSRKRMREIINMPTRSVDEWIVATNGTTIYVTESRSINFCLNLYKFILTIGLLWTDPDKLIWWMASAVIVLLPYCVLTALGAVVVLGKALYITDDDLEHALGCVGLTGMFRWILRYTGSSKAIKSNILAPAVSEDKEDGQDDLELVYQRRNEEGALGEESRAARIEVIAGLGEMSSSENSSDFNERDNLYDVYEDKDEELRIWERVQISKSNANQDALIEISSPIRIVQAPAEDELANVGSSPRQKRDSDFKGSGRTLFSNTVNSFSTKKSSSSAEDTALKKAEGAGVHTDKGILVFPSPGYVIKTRRSGDSEAKVFINVCHSPAVGRMLIPRSDITLDKNGTESVLYMAVLTEEKYKEVADTKDESSKAIISKALIARINEIWKDTLLEEFVSVKKAKSYVGDKDLQCTVPLEYNAAHLASQVHVRESESRDSMQSVLLQSISSLNRTQKAKVMAEDNDDDDEDDDDDEEDDDDVDDEAMLVSTSLMASRSFQATGVGSPIENLKASSNLADGPIGKKGAFQLVKGSRPSALTSAASMFSKLKPLRSKRGDEQPALLETSEAAAHSIPIENLDQV